MYNQNYMQEVSNNDITKIAHRVAAIVNADATPGVVARALNRYENMFSSYIVTLQQVFTSTSQQATPTQNIDGSFGFICKQFTIQTTSSDTDQFITAINLSSATSLILNNLPIAVITRLTGLFQPFEMFWPPNSQIQVGLQNGATTSSATMRVVFFGFRVPVAFINEVTAKQQQLKQKKQG